MPPQAVADPRPAVVPGGPAVGSPKHHPVTTIPEHYGPPPHAAGEEIMVLQAPDRVALGDRWEGSEFEEAFSLVVHALGAAAVPPGLVGTCGTL